MTKSTKTYAQLQSELDEIMDWFASDHADLDEALAKYKQAGDLIKQLEDYIANARNQVTKIKQSFGK